MSHGMTAKEWKIHPVCALFPSMAPAEFKELVEDIKRNGLLEPIVTHGSWIIDGKNRLAACEEAGAAPRFSEWDGKGSLVAFSLSKNLKRRNLTASERAVIAAESLPIFQQEAKSRQEAQGERGKEGGRGKAKPLASPDAKGSDEGKAARDAAEVAGVSRAQVERADELKRKDPPKFAEVKAGKKTVGQAHRELKEEEAAQAQQAPPMDGLGRPVTIEKLHDVFRSEEFGDILRDMGRIKRSVMALCGTPLGAFIHPQSIETDIGNVIRHLRASRPYTVCSYCRDAGGCKACRKQGWVTKDVHEATPEDMRR